MIPRILRSPQKYVQGAGAYAQAAAHFRELGDRICFFTSAGGMRRVSPELQPGLQKNGLDVYFVTTNRLCTQAEVDRLCQLVKENDCDVVAGVGGGTVIDLAKAVSHEIGLPLAIMPTVASSDAPCSAVSVLYHEDGTFDRYLFLSHSPNLVLIDTQQIANASPRLLAAGIGDALATYFEARAIRQSGKNNQVQGKSTLAAQAMAEVCLKILMDDAAQAMQAVKVHVCTKALENVVEANTLLSGIGFESGGLAAAHAIQKGFTAIRSTHQFYHGEIVAFSTLVQLVLENAPRTELDMVLQFLSEINLPVCLEQIGIGQAEWDQLQDVAEIAVGSDMTIHHMPFEVSADTVLAAILVADQLGRNYTSKQTKVNKNYKNEYV